MLKFLARCSKVETSAICSRTVAHLLNIDDGWARNVALGLGLKQLPKAAQPTQSDLPASPALSILLNSPKIAAEGDGVRRRTLSLAFPPASCSAYAVSADPLPGLGMMNVAETLLHGLMAYGNGESFGIPRDLALPYFKVAGPMGGDGRRVATRAEPPQALEHAAATRGRFQLIEAMIPRGAMSATLSRFVAGVKRLHAAKEAA